MTAFRFASVRAAFFRATFVAAAFAGVFLVAPASVAAQNDMLGGMRGEGIGGRPFKIVIDGGISLVNGQVKGVHENGFHFGASIVYPIPGLRLAIRPEFTYTTLRFKQTVVPSRGLGEKNYMRALTGLAHVEVPMPNGAYVFAGAGGVNVESVIARDSTQRRGTSLMVDVGAGYRYEFGPILAFLEARFATAAADNQKFRYSRVNMLPLSFGFVF